jgi:hypothetical protein
VPLILPKKKKKAPAAIKPKCGIDVSTGKCAATGTKDKYCTTWGKKGKCKLTQAGKKMKIRQRKVAKAGAKPKAKTAKAAKPAKKKGAKPAKKKGAKPAKKKGASKKKKNVPQPGCKERTQYKYTQRRRHPKFEAGDLGCQGQKKKGTGTAKLYISEKRPGKASWRWYVEKSKKKAKKKGAKPKKTVAKQTCKQIADSQRRVKPKFLAEDCQGKKKKVHGITWESVVTKKGKWFWKKL